MESQLVDMERLGLLPRGLNDGIERQTERRKSHWRAFLRAVSEGVAHPCICSRKEVEQELAEMASAPHVQESGGEAPSYAGTCMVRGREQTLNLHSSASHLGSRTLAWRFGSRHTVIARTENADLSSPEACSFEPSYHWACALDDCNPAREHSLLVRAWDLAHATPIQREIQSWSEGPDFQPPTVFHTSLLTQDDGQRLEKRTRGVALDELLETGWSIQRLIERFEASFDSETVGHDLLDSARGAILGERHRSLTLSALLATPAR